MHVRRRTVRGRLALLPTVGLTAVVLTTATGSFANSATNTSGPPSIQGEAGTLPNVDNRAGRTAPTQAQRASVKPGSEARFNKFGAPKALSGVGTFLATGLPGGDVAAAQAYLSNNRELLGLSADEVASLELVNAPPIGRGSAVLFRQVFDGLEAGRDGLVAVGVAGGKVAFLSSSLTTDTTVTNEVALSPEDAVQAAAKAAGQPAGSVSSRRSENGWLVMDVKGYTDPARARLVGVPTPTNGVRRAYEVLLMDVSGVNPIGAMSYIDAETGALLLRDGIVDYASDNPAWKVFAASPPQDYSTTDIRELWCWTMTPSVPDCDQAVANDASPAPWDVDAALGTPWFLTRGNNARATEKWLSNVGSQQGTNYAASATRDYVYPWTNQWQEVGCDPAAFTSPELNDIDAARANLHAMHNKMHDWAYVLGFTETTFNAQAFNFGLGGAENDPEHGNAQAGGIVGGPPGFQSRDNANQFSPFDGIVPVTNMFLWQPIPASFYGPCVDGDYDMSVIAHEYTHLISNRMVAGPNANLSGDQAGAMGESWSDLSAAEFLNSQGLVPLGTENPFSVGPYVTGDKVAGIRNFGMNMSPLNYSDVGYDFACNQAQVCTRRSQVHADGEIWSATNYDIRQALIEAYDDSFPADDLALQRACIRGEVPVDECPGNRRWAQLEFDAWLLMASGAVSMVDARNAMLAADLLRFSGANQEILWNTFARRGLGRFASADDTNDFDPTPSFESPYAENATVRFRPGGDASGEPVQLFVGRYEAAITPIADTDPATPLGDTFKIVPGTYEFVARGNGFGMERFTERFRPDRNETLRVSMSDNLASSTNGATASGDGVNLDKLIDDTEVTNWASLVDPVAGQQVTVELAPHRSPHHIRRVQVSAMLRTNTGDTNDPGGQSRFSALRKFEIWTCEAKHSVDCSQDSQFRRIFTSPANAFPSGVPRPRAPELIMRSFNVPQTKATHVRLVVVTNQCTGGPAYQGDQDNDPANSTDCDETTLPGFNVNATRVRAAELQVFSDR